MKSKKDKNTVTRNYIYNTLYQLLAIALPVITTPYLSRVLGAENIGIFSYTTSVTAYFILLGSLGVAIYGQREIAYVHKNKDNASKTFFEIFLLKLITMIVSILLFSVIFVIRRNSYNMYYMILILELLSNVFDICWFFQGFEDFKKVVFRNLMIKLISVACIFLFIKTKEDLIYYFIIYASSSLLSNFSLWLYLPKYIDKVSLKSLNIFRHLKPVFIMFIPQIAIQIYTVLDKTMIGKIINNKAEVGFYTQGEKIIKLLLVIVSSLGTVMLPRIAKKFAEKDNNSIKRYLNKSFNFTLLISLPLVLGLILVSNDFVPIFFGEGYDKVSIIMKIISPIIIFIGISGIIGYQYFLPTKHQKEYTTSVIIGAISNFTINLFLIPKYGAIGAAVGTVFAEFLVALVEMIIARKFFDYKLLLRENYKYILFSIIMFIICDLTNIVLKLQGFKLIIIDVLLGGAIYLILLIIFKDKLLMESLSKFKLMRGKNEEVN